MAMKVAASVDAYIAGFTEETKKRLEEMRHIVNKAAPKAVEVISYGMPAVKINGIIVYYAGYKKHIGLYPHGSPIKAFEAEISKYKYSKGAVQFPLDKALPAALITKIVKFRVKEDAAKYAIKQKPEKDFIQGLSAPAKRALEAKGITSLQKLAKHSEADLLQLHGIGPTAIPKLKQSLQAAGLSFKK